MIEEKMNALPLWHFESLKQFSSIQHYVSGRRGGVSSGEKSSLNLSFKVGDNPEDVVANRRKISDRFDIPPYDLIFPVQTHSVNVGVIKANDQNFEDTDALVCNTEGICISVMSADCVPVLLYDPIEKVIGAAHAGWKGTVGKIASKTVQVMKEQFHCSPANILACIGPSISPEVYQVGKEVVDEVVKSFGSKEGLIHSETPDGKAYLNLWEANRKQLLDIGLHQDHIEVAGICTYKNAHEFFSARHSKNQAGRFAAGIMLG
jgi:hypothetical protein